MLSASYTGSVKPLPGPEEGGKFNIPYPMHTAAAASHRLVPALFAGAAIHIPS